MFNQVQEQKANPWEPPCFLYDITFNKYLEIEAASSHSLGTLLNKSPLHVKESTDKPSVAKSLGTIVHAMILEPEKADEQIAVMPDGANKASNAGKSILLGWLESVTATTSSSGAGLAEGKMLSARIADLEPLLNDVDVTVCSAAQYDTARRMRDNTMAKDLGRVIFSEGQAEVTMMAVDPTSGVLCKGRADWLPEGHDLIVDLKTAASAAYEEFARAAARYNYHLQAAFYRGLYHLVTGAKRPSFLHVVVESEPPYDCAFYELDQDAIQSGEQRVKRALDVWRLCEKSGKWPGIGYDFQMEEYQIQSLQLPRWAL